ncbi:Uncharacterised protein [Mycobacteroides abscessus subsp. massiliense]|nr:Uncharacterised protein [Mycobacteroides abscessus subsp. massiliense]
MPVDGSIIGGAGDPPDITGGAETGVPAGATCTPAAPAGPATPAGPPPAPVNGCTDGAGFTAAGGGATVEATGGTAEPVLDNPRAKAAPGLAAAAGPPPEFASPAAGFAEDRPLPSPDAGFCPRPPITDDNGDEPPPRPDPNPPAPLPPPPDGTPPPPNGETPGRGATLGDPSVGRGSSAATGPLATRLYDSSSSPEFAAPPLALPFSLPALFVPVSPLLWSGCLGASSRGRGFCRYFSSSGCATPGLGLGVGSIGFGAGDNLKLSAESCAPPVVSQRAV